jgi:anti-anti-sigma regulatory factor
MPIIHAGPDKVVVGGELSDDCVASFDRALQALHSSSVQTPTVDLMQVSYVSSRAIGLLVATWVELSHQGRWFDLYASDKVWGTLEKAGVARVFFKRP